MSIRNRQRARNPQKYLKPCVRRRRTDAILSFPTSDVVHRADPNQSYIIVYETHYAPE